MASLFGALGSLAESYGLARQNIEESNLRRVQQQTEASRLKMEQDRLETEKRRADMEGARLKIEEGNLIDMGLPDYVDPHDGKTYMQRYSPYEGKIVKKPYEGQVGTGPEALRTLINQYPQEFRPELTTLAQTQLSIDPRDIKGTQKAIAARAEKLEDASATRKAEEERRIATQKAEDARQLREFKEREKLKQMGDEGDTTPADNPTIDKYSDWLAGDKISLDEMAKIFVGKKGDALRSKIVDAAMRKGWNPQTQLTASSATALEAAEPTLNTTNDLIATIERLGLDKNNTPGYLTIQRGLYRMGRDAPAGTLGAEISSLSMERVLGAASVLKGASRSLAALKAAMDHLPDPWVSSPSQMHTQLVKVRNRLQDVVDDIKKYGTKTGLPNVAIGKDFGPAPSGKVDGSTGTLDDGTKIVVRRGRLVGQ